MKGRLTHCLFMVITMTNKWMHKYQSRDEFLTWFLSEQEYIDAMFVQIVMFNFGVWLNMDELLPVENT